MVSHPEREREREKRKRKRREREREYANIENGRESERARESEWARVHTHTHTHTHTHVYIDIWTCAHPRTGTQRRINTWQEHTAWCVCVVCAYACAWSYLISMYGLCTNISAINKKARRLRLPAVISNTVCRKTCDTLLRHSIQGSNPASEFVCKYVWTNVGWLVLTCVWVCLCMCACVCVCEFMFVVSSAE